MEEKATQAAAAPKPKKPLPKSRIMVSEQLAQLYQDTMDAKARGEKIGWSASIFPQEIAEALGLYIVYPENQAAGLAARHYSEEFLTHAESKGYNMDICSYARTNLAYMDLMKAPTSNMPKPDFVLCCNNICNQLTKWFENLAHEFQVPMFLIDTVYNYDSCASEEKVKYVRSQIDDLIRGLEEISGRKLDPDRLHEVMKISLRNKDLWREANELLAAKPAPLAGFDLFNYMSCLVICRGKRSTTEIFKQLKKEIEEHIANGTSTFPSEEKYRVHWEGIACWPNLGFNLKTLKNYNVNAVMNGYVTAWDVLYTPGNLDEMARAYQCSSTNSFSTPAIMQKRVDSIRDFGCEGMLCHVNRSCKLMTFHIHVGREIVDEKAHVPVATFDGDQSDPRIFNEAQFETRLQGLVEIMEEKKEGAANV